MDIDLRVLKLMETERGIPFEELCEILEQAILTAYQKHELQMNPPARVERPKGEDGKPAPRPRFPLKVKGALEWGANRLPLDLMLSP